MVDLDLRFRQMDEFGDDYRQVISLPAPPIEDLGAPPAGREFARLGNEGLARLVAEHPDRFAGFVAALPMNDPEGTLDEIDHACGELGALGVQIYTHVNGHPLDEERFEPFWAGWPRSTSRSGSTRAATRAGRTTRPRTSRSTRSGGSSAGSTTPRRSWRGSCSPACSSAIPELKILIHHGGSMVPHFAGRVGPGWDQLGARTPPDRRHDVEHPPLSKRPLDYFKMFYADTAMFGAAHAIRCCIEFFGADHVLFACDTPFDPEKGPGYIRVDDRRPRVARAVRRGPRQDLRGQRSPRAGSQLSGEAFILDAVRTPFGRYGGALAGVRPDDLAAHVVRALLARAPELDPARIDDVVFGDANGAGEDNRNVARMAVLLAGLPTSVPASPSTGCAARASTRRCRRAARSRPATRRSCWSAASSR